MGVTPLFDRILIVPVLIALSAMTFSSSAASDIIPRPKEIRLTGGTIALPAGSTAIVLGDKASEPEKYAAETLQADVARRFRQTWPIVLESSDLRALKELIVLGQRSTNGLIDRLCREWKVDLSEESPGLDGYVIRMGRELGRDVVLVGGSNERGVIYGQDTLFQLTTRKGNEIVLTEASVRDWPSIPWRGKPQTSYTRHLNPGEADWYARGRLNFTDLRNGTYAFEPGAELDEAQIRKAVNEVHPRGMIVYATVNCGIPKAQHDAALSTFKQLIGLGADGLWISFDDMGPGEAPEELVQKVLDLGREHGMSGHLIAICPPKGDYQFISAEFNRTIAAIPGMSDVLWFFTSIPSAKGSRDARAAGINSKPAWWHNWPRTPGHGMVGISAHSVGFLGGSGYSRPDGKPPYLPIPTLAEGWHQPSYDALAGAGEWTSAVMQWGGTAWKYEWTYPVLGWWAWSPETHDWNATRRRAYELVYGPELIGAGMAFDDALYELRKLFLFSIGSNEVDPMCPPRLLSARFRPRVRGLIADMESALVKLQAARPAESFATPERLSANFLDAAGAEVIAAKACMELPFPEYWWDNHQRKVLDAIYDGDLPRADRLIDAVRSRVSSEVKQIGEKLGEMEGLDKHYVTPWTERASLDAAGWRKLIQGRPAQFDKLIADLEYQKFGDPTALLLKGLSTPPQDRLPVTQSVVAGGRETWSGAHLSGLYGGAYTLAYPLKVISHQGEYDEVEVRIPLSGSKGWHGVRFFINSWSNDTIALERVVGRYLGRRFVQLLLDDKMLWESDVAVPRGEGEWITVGLPESLEGQREYKLRLRIEDREESYNYSSAVFVSPFHVFFAAR